MVGFTTTYREPVWIGHQIRQQLLDEERPEAGLGVKVRVRARIISVGQG